MLTTIPVSLLIIGKIFFLIAIAIYIVFSLVVIKQTNLMIGTLDAGFNGFIKLVAWGHFLFAVFVFITAFLIL